VLIIIPARPATSGCCDARGADRLTQLWKQQIVFSTVPVRRADRRTGCERRRKDGYTLYMKQASTWTVLPVTQEKLPFDFTRFPPIAWSACSRSRSPSRRPRSEDPGRADRPDPADIGGMLFAASNRGGHRI